MTTTRAYVLVAGYLLVIYAAVAMLHCVDAPTPPPAPTAPNDDGVVFNHTTPDFIRSSATMTGATDGEEDSHLIEIAAAADVTPALLAPFHSAAEWWTNVIRETNFKPARISAHQSAQCLPDVDAMDMEIPGLRILVQVHPIDGEGNTLGYSRPCFLHPHGAAVTVLGSMEFDSADIELMIRRGIAHDVVRHEMGHVLGIGTLWSRAGVLDQDNHTYTGEWGMSAYQELGGSGPVPVENSTGQPGSDDGHWRETVFGSELMTYRIHGSPRPMSILTILSLRDLGYNVDRTRAESYQLP